MSDTEDLILLTEALEEGGEEVPSELLELEEFLQQSILLTALDAKGRALLAAKGRYRWAMGGEIIVREGDAGDSFFLIKSGEVKVHTRDPKGSILELATLKAGQFFGEVALLNKKPRTATVTTDDDAELYEFHRDDIESILADYPDLAAQLQSLILERSEDTIRKMGI